MSHIHILDKNCPQHQEDCKNKRSGKTYPVHLRSTVLKDDGQMANNIAPGRDSAGSCSDPRSESELQGDHHSL